MIPDKLCRACKAKPARPGGITCWECADRLLKRTGTGHQLAEKHRLEQERRLAKDAQRAAERCDGSLSV